MSFEFTENLTLYIPQIEEQVKNMTEAATTGTNKLIIELAAIHEGLTSNYNNYPAKALEESLSTWVQPYAKPIILNHDPESEAVGRVMAARMDKETDGSPYIRLQVGVTSPEAIAKCLDERFLTGSVGGKAESAKCSICSTDWAKASGYSLPCKHERGKIYNGKLTSLELDGLNWKEYSFVNIPADQKSSFRNIMLSTPQGESVADDDGGWIRAVSFYSVDMNKESIIELFESAAPRDVLSGMKKKDAHAIYLNVKGTFLSASAHDYFENSEEKSLNDETYTTINNESGDDMPITQNSAEENDMSQATDTATETEEEDILTVTDALSADLASTKEEEISEEDTTEGETTDEVVEPEEKEEEKEEEVITEGEEQLTDTETTVEQANESEETSSTETEESDAITQVVVDDLKSQVASFQEDNARLRKALHNVLAERVVDAKIAVGILESDERADAVAEHSKRTASSLADSLRDLKDIPSVMPKREISTEMKTKLAAVSTDDDHSEILTNENTTVEVIEISPENKLVGIMTDALMGRKQL